MKNMGFRKMLYVISIISFIATILMSVALPYVANWYLNAVNGGKVSIGTLVFIYLTIIPFLVILFSVIKLCRNLAKDNSFSEENLHGLKVIGICAFIDFIIYLAGTVFIFRNLVCFVLSFATLMVFVLSFAIRELIKNGIEIKEEINLTI